MSPEPSAHRTCIVLVGGFLGSGKTSLILAAARLLEQRGLRCALILNDQGDELVDTHHAQQQGLLAREVTGGCFSCRLSAFTSAIEELRAWSPHVIFAEPVGSCTDIAATVLGPLREDFNACRLAPFTVLVDPARATALLSPDADPDLAFLFEKQLQEADLVCMSKADLFPDASALPNVEARRLSAKTGQGVPEWLDEILGGVLEPGMTPIDVDYARYARAEAALAWLNLTFVFEPASPLSPALVVGPLMDRLDARRFSWVSTIARARAGVAFARRLTSTSCLIAGDASRCPSTFGSSPLAQVAAFSHPAGERSNTFR